MDNQATHAELVTTSILHPLTQKPLSVDAKYRLVPSPSTMFADVSAAPQAMMGRSYHKHQSSLLALSQIFNTHARCQQHADGSNRTSREPAQTERGSLRQWERSHHPKQFENSPVRSQGCHRVVQIQRQSPFPTYELCWRSGDILEAQLPFSNQLN